jgi:hypothetical protein
MTRVRSTCANHSMRCRCYAAVRQRAPFASWGKLGAGFEGLARTMSNMSRNHRDALKRADSECTAFDDQTICGYLLGDTSDSSQCGGRIDRCDTDPELCVPKLITLPRLPATKAKSYPGNIFRLQAATAKRTELKHLQAASQGYA